MRAWSLDVDDYEDEATFRAAVQTELAMSEYLGYRLGVAVVSAPIRAQRVPGGEFETVGWTFRTATVPAIRFSDDVKAAAPETVQAAAEAALEPDEDAEQAAPELADVSY